MIGAIAGDIIGSVYEHHRLKTVIFPLFQAHSRFTDDSVLTVAVADALLHGQSYRDAVLIWGRRYPDAGYGGKFTRWLDSENPEPYHSWGNGSAMRVSPVGWAFDTEEEVLRQARMTAVITHDHPEGVKGAQAIALAIFLARTGTGKATIRARIQDQFGYDLTRTIASIRPDYKFRVSCQRSVPEALIAFLDTDSYEDAVRNAISLGGDADTLACMAGSVAEAFYGGVPEAIRRETQTRLDFALWAVVEAFSQRYCQV
ncbi:MAG: ADP-ribosylglycohydrolase family protein [Gammaproteobacteria bacterium]|nr:ADP-ribosylglycohydrolase family protein [Gammaproteobacteria bacterium]